MTTSGVVLSKHGGVSKVRVGHMDGCSGCGKCGKYRDKVVTASDSTDSAVGDTVTLEISDKKYALSVLLLYVCPLIGLTAGVVAGYYLISPLFEPKSVDMVSVLCGIITMLSVYAVVWLCRGRIDKKAVASVTAVTGKENHE